MNKKSAISKINKLGVLLVFPINNRAEPLSLWSEFFPRKKMRWEWDENGDEGVADLWHLMKRLSAERDVVYSKWYLGRATFFSRELFAAMLKLMKTGDAFPVTPAGRSILDVLESDSPLSTRDLKKLTELQGRLNEPTYSRGMKELFSKLLIVGCGEVEDGAFPSLSVGATRLIYEDLLEEALKMPVMKANDIVDRVMPHGTLVRRFFDRQCD